MNVNTKPTYHVEVKERKVTQDGGKESCSNNPKNEKR
ncbi:hypothetical protein SAMN05518683_10372 [Salibacterium halotolerans]|uniref:Uncharacterized protein n=1 Tax=Salibacterium halotolerans TaxID=1884432 RepID=A0A1I5ND90_9BACI|nr:hypothetical protein SAMN05518683_10372 [Salibacterium halotolerans]